MGQYSQIIETTATVLGGFPVIARGTVVKADLSVGISYPYVEDVELFTTKRKPASFIEKRMAERDWDAVDEAIMVSFDGGRL